MCYRGSKHCTPNGNKQKPLRAIHKILHSIPEKNKPKNLRKLLVMVNYNKCIGSVFLPQIYADLLRRGVFTQRNTLCNSVFSVVKNSAHYPSTKAHKPLSQTNRTVSSDAQQEGISSTSGRVYRDPSL